MNLKVKSNELAVKINDSLRGKFIHQFRKGEQAIEVKNIIYKLVFEELDLLHYLTVKDGSIKCKEQRFLDKKGMIEKPNPTFKNRIKFLFTGKF